MQPEPEKAQLKIKIGVLGWHNIGQLAVGVGEVIRVLRLTQ
jgi:hypothetical protein